MECKTWGNYSTQIFYPYGSSSNLAYMRSCSYWEGYHWTEWQQIIVSNPSIDWDTGHFNIGNIKIAWAAVNCDNGEFNINCTLPISFEHFSVILCVPYYNSSPNSQVFSTWGGANTNVVSAHVRSVDTNAFKFLAIGY